MNIPAFRTMTGLASALLLAACDTGDDPERYPEQEASQTVLPSGQVLPEEPLPAYMAKATLEPRSGSDLDGQVALWQDGDTVTLKGAVTGLAPGLHGFHVHETGDCSAPDASSAGGHFEPEKAPHGPPSAPASAHHAGDLGNIRADSEGNAAFTLTSDDLALEPGANGIVGRALVVHAGRDDLSSQPSGDAGARVGCGVIEEVEPDRSAPEQGAPAG